MTKMTKLIKNDKNFKAKVINFIKTVPKGKVVSYGQAAAVCGKPRGAREVGRILRSIDTSKKVVPWWRVLNNRGVISIKGNWTADKELQGLLLRKEGVEVSEGLTLDIEKYRLGFMHQVSQWSSSRK